MSFLTSIPNIEPRSIVASAAASAFMPKETLTPDQTAMLGQLLTLKKFFMPGQKLRDILLYVNEQDGSNTSCFPRRIRGHGGFDMWTTFSILESWILIAIVVSLFTSCFIYRRLNSLPSHDLHRHVELGDCPRGKDREYKIKSSTMVEDLEKSERIITIVEDMTKSLGSDEYESTVCDASGMTKGEKDGEKC